MTDEKQILLLSPMECESDTVRRALQNVTHGEYCGFGYMCGTLDGREILSVRTRIGTVNAAVATALFLSRQRPSCVIMLGTSGAHAPDLYRNDIVLGEEIVPLTNYISPARAEGEGICPEKWFCPGVQVPMGDHMENIRVFRSDESLLAAAQSVPYSHGKVVRGRIGTGDLWNREADMIRFCRKVYRTDCEEMEGFAVAQTCAMFRVPFLLIRVISNNELHPDGKFDKKTAEYGQQFCMDLLCSLAEQRPER